MAISVRAWRLRESARAALLAGSFDSAAALAAEARELQSGPGGEALLRLASWLSA